jgi:hypothetical protein
VRVVALRGSYSRTGSDKRCHCCQQVFPVDKFIKSFSTRDGRCKRDTLCNACRTIRMGAKNHKISVAHFCQIYGNGTCYCCGSADRNLTVDHCHETGRIRGMLCHLCNVLMGVARDSTGILYQAVTYLNTYNRGSATAEDAERLEAYKMREDQQIARRQSMPKRKKAAPPQAEILAAIASINSRLAKDRLRIQPVQLRLIA